MQADTLRNVLTGVFMALGVPSRYSAITADALVYANLRCLDSHGVSRGLDYVEGIKRGEINPSPKLRVVRETVVSALVDGDGGIGPPVAAEVAEVALKKAREAGVSVAAARNLRDVGALGYYVSKVVSAGYVGVAVANAKARVSLPGARSPLVGTNPIAVGIPAERPILLDMALSVVSYGRLVNAARRKEPIPVGWAVTKNGKPTTDPKEAMEGYLLPAGGYKGLALAIVVDIIAGPMLGAPTSHRISGMGPYTQGGFLMVVVDPALFRDPHEIEEDIKEYAETFKKITQEGVVEAHLPGERAEMCREDRELRGIPLDPEVLDRLVEVVRELGLDPSILFR